MIVVGPAILIDAVQIINGSSGTLAFPGTIGEVDIGSLEIFDTVKANLARMSVSSPNAAFLERGAEYSIRLSFDVGPAVHFHQRGYSA